MKFIRGIIEKSPLHYPVRNVMLKYTAPKRLARWEQQGRPVPPPRAYKQQILAEHAERYGLRVMVETGTFYGDMIQAMRSRFDLIYSIELSEQLHSMAVKRFRREAKVKLLQGNSGTMLKTVIEELDQPALFWLDAHYSSGITARDEKDTPIYEELEHLLDSRIDKHVILIDDARCFGADPAYPAIEQLCHFVLDLRMDRIIEVADDVIRILPPTDEVH